MLDFRGLWRPWRSKTDATSFFPENHQALEPQRARGAAAVRRGGYMYTYASEWITKISLNKQTLIRQLVLNSCFLHFHLWRSVPSFWTPKSDSTSKIVPLELVSRNYKPNLLALPKESPPGTTSETKPEILMKMRFLFFYWFMTNSFIGFRHTCTRAPLTT